jgi:hypothetical protein
LVQLGAYNLKNKNEDWTERKIEDIYVHPDFDISSEAAYNDAAVLKLSEAVIFSDIVRPICLPKDPTFKADHLAGGTVSVSGWGEHKSSSDTLKSADMKINDQRY